MPKEKTPFRQLIKTWIIGKNGFTTDGDILYCQTCNQKVNCSKKCHIDQHERTKNHVKRLTNLATAPQQRLITEDIETRRNPFFYDLCNLMASCMIPWNKVQNPVFRQFFADYCNKQIPSESTLRKNYLPQVYKQKILSIRNDISDNDIYLTVDETTDACGRYICNVIVGKLCGDAPGVPHLLACKVLSKCNHATVSRCVNSSLEILWPDHIFHERVKIMISDAAPYMIKCATTLKVFYPNLLHITCLAHGLNLVCEVVRNYFPNVNSLIKYTKQVFLKAPTRVQHYKDMLPDVSLPPEPILTRWGTWLEAAFFYADHFNDIKNVILGFGAESAQSIKEAQKCFQNENIHIDLTYIKAHFAILVSAIKKLETQGLPLSDSLAILNNVKESLSNVPGNAGKSTFDKLKNVINKNPDLHVLENINKILCGNTTGPLQLFNGVELTPEDMIKFKNSPVTSCDVERSFSAYKQVLSDRRQSLSENSIEQLLVIYCEAKNTN